MNSSHVWVSYLPDLQKETQISEVRPIPVPPLKLGRPKGDPRKEWAAFRILVLTLHLCVSPPLTFKCINSLLRSFQEYLNLFSSSLED